MEESSKKRKTHLVTYHTREIDRNIARNNMIKQGIRQFNKNKYGDGSFFSKNWRSYSNN